MLEDKTLLVIGLDRVIAGDSMANCIVQQHAHINPNGKAAIGFTRLFKGEQSREEMVAIFRAGCNKNGDFLRFFGAFEMRSVRLFPGAGEYYPYRPILGIERPRLCEINFGLPLLTLRSV